MNAGRCPSGDDQSLLSFLNGVFDEMGNVFAPERGGLGPGYNLGSNTVKDARGHPFAEMFMEQTLYCRRKTFYLRALAALR